MNTPAAQQLPNHQQLNSPFLNAIHKHKSHFSKHKDNGEQWRTIANTKRQTMAHRHENNGRQGLKKWRGKNGNTPRVILPNLPGRTDGRITAGQSHNLGFFIDGSAQTGPVKRLSIYKV